jgi:hypothetical protein
MLKRKEGLNPEAVMIIWVKCLFTLERSTELMVLVKVASIPEYHALKSDQVFRP